MSVLKLTQQIHFGVLGEPVTEGRGKLFSLQCDCVIQAVKMNAAQKHHSGCRFACLFEIICAFTEV